MQHKHIDGRDFNENDIPIGLYFTAIYIIIKSQIQRMILCTFFPFSLLTTIGYRLSTVQIFVGMPSRGFVILQYLIFEKAYLISCSTQIADVDSI